MKAIGIVCAGFACSTALAQEATFRILRNESFPFLGMEFPRAVSADGTVVAGSYGVRWTRGSGVVPAGFIPGTQKIKIAWSLNANGTIEVGSPEDGLGRYWTESGVTTYVHGTPIVASQDFLGPCQMTDDGAWVIGYATGAGRPARTNRLGYWELFPTTGFENVRAFATSADGGVVVGFGTNSGVQFGIAWQVGAGSADASGITVVDDFSAIAVSADGKKAVGQRGNRAAVWAIGGGVEVFNPPIGFTSASGYSISGDGGVVVGFAGAPSGNTVFVRRSGEQARDLRAVLARFGSTDADYYRLQGGIGVVVSRDARVVCGPAYSPWYGTWAFVATIPTWAPCPSDLNFDGLVDDSDFSVFAKEYDQLATIDGDLNVDQFTDDADFSIFAAAYDALLCP
jgi:hypothetical protein